MGKMPLFPDALVNAVMGYGVVFAGLIMLLVVVTIMGVVMAAKKTGAASPAAQGAAAPAAPAKDGAVAPGSAGKIALHSVSDRDAALIMAIVADQLGKPINELRFKSIKEVK